MAVPASIFVPSMLKVWAVASWPPKWMGNVARRLCRWPTPTAGGGAKPCGIEHTKTSKPSSNERRGRFMPCKSSSYQMIEFALHFTLCLCQISCRSPCNFNALVRTMPCSKSPNHTKDRKLTVWAARRNKRWGSGWSCSQWEVHERNTKNIWKNNTRQDRKIMINEKSIELNNYPLIQTKTSSES